MKNKIQENENQNTEIQIPNAKKKKRGDEDQHRVVISKEANDTLEALMNKTNDGFVGGETTKSDVANLILMNAPKSFSEADIKALRTLHFNERKMLKAMLRDVSDKGGLPEEIKRALRDHYGLNENTRKRSSKNSNELSTEKNVNNLNAA